MKKTSTVVAPISPSAEKDINSVRLSSSVTVERYRAMELAEDRNGLARFIHERLVERYALPLSLSCRKNGFSMMAASCLLIETLESFYRGWGDTSNRMKPSDIDPTCRPVDPKRTTVSMSEVAFCYFFQRFSRFASLQPFAQPFYVNVRCGILHQGETAGGGGSFAKELCSTQINMLSTLKYFLKKLDLLWKSTQPLYCRLNGMTISGSISRTR